MTGPPALIFALSLLFSRARMSANGCVAVVGDDFFRRFLVASIACWKSLRFPSLWWPWASVGMAGALGQFWRGVYAAVVAYRQDLVKFVTAVFTVK